MSTGPFTIGLSGIVVFAVAMLVNWLGFHFFVFRHMKSATDGKWIAIWNICLLLSMLLTIVFLHLSVRDYAHLDVAVYAGLLFAAAVLHGLYFVKPLMKLSDRVEIHRLMAMLVGLSIVFLMGCISILVLGFNWGQEVYLKNTCIERLEEQLRAGGSPDANELRRVAEMFEAIESSGNSSAFATLAANAQVSSVGDIADSLAARPAVWSRKIVEPDMLPYLIEASKQASWLYNNDGMLKEARALIGWTEAFLLAVAALLIPFLTSLWNSGNEAALQMRDRLLSYLDSGNVKEAAKSKIKTNLEAVNSTVEVLTAIGNKMRPVFRLSILLLALLFMGITLINFASHGEIVQFLVILGIKTLTWLMLLWFLTLVVVHNFVIQQMVGPAKQVEMLIIET